MIELSDTPLVLAQQIGAVRCLNAELLYQPRSTEPRRRAVFDAALRSRWAGLSADDAVLLLCADAACAASVQAISAAFPHLRVYAAQVNPAPLAGVTPAAPFDWPMTAGRGWQRYTLTDRWARLVWALQVAAELPPGGYLSLPAHDAVWGAGLLERLIAFSQRQARNGLPAFVSPYTYHQHSPVDGVDIPPEIIDLLNVAFARDVWFGWKLRLDRVQGLWGKMALLPFGGCAALLRGLRQNGGLSVWEDDLAMDSTLRQLGYAVRGWFVRDPRLYRQALPVFDRAAARRVIERTLHYSLNIPGQPVGGSTLNTPLDRWGKLRLVSPRWRRANALAEALIAECVAEISQRLAHWGASWVDWGAYRYVVRVGDPAVEVWKQA